MFPFESAPSRTKAGMFVISARYCPVKPSYMYQADPGKTPPRNEGDEVKMYGPTSPNWSMVLKFSIMPHLKGSVVFIVNKVCPLYKLMAMIPCWLPVFVVYQVVYSMPSIITGAYLGSYCDVVQ